MYLKRLDIHGFKSFANRTSFEFGHAITSIVGPNGSGKSNIADAFRWALGEQSGRLMRARKLEDVIFAGSSQRPSAKKAEVTITLDNSAGWLPIDFAEVAITRRAYRSSESDYLINHKRVRLRNVQDLLRANAGRNSYAIIGQGLVETVLNLRPEERRQLIEEAADIQRFRLKVEEAQDKLAATRENMERVQLLSKEIAPRLTSLERQAKRAAEHIRLAKELGQALQVWYEYHWHHALEALAVARAAHDQAQAEETQVRLAIETCQRELESITKELEQKRTASAASAADRERLSARVRELEQTVAIAEQRHSILELRHQALEAESAALTEERAKAAEAVEADVNRKGDIQQELTAARQALDEKNRELKELEEEFRGMQAKTGAAEEKAARLETTANDIVARLQRLSLSEAELDKEVARLDIRRRSSISQMAEIVRVLRGIRAQETEAAANVLAAAGRRDELETEVSNLRVSLIALESKQHLRRGKLEALQTRLTILHEAQEQYRAQPEESQEAVQVEGFLAAVHEIVRVPKGLETAIEAALADYIEGNIVTYQREAIAAAEAIARHGLRRTYVLPLESIKSAPPLNIMKERGVLGVASKLIKCDPRYQSLIDTLLGRVIVVQDVDMAARVLRRGMGTVVTLDGIVFHPSGSVSAGYPQVSQRPNILGHERDLEAIPKEIERTSRSLEVTEREVQALQARLHEAEGRLSNLTREVDSAQAKRLRIQDSIGGRKQRLAQLKGEIRGVITAQASIREQANAFSQEAQRLQAERESMLVQAQEDQDLAQYLRRAAAIVTQRRDAILRSISEASARVAEFEGELRSLEAMRQASQAALARFDSQIAAKRMQTQGLDTELSGLTRNSQDDEAALAAAREELASLAYQPQEETIPQLESRQRELHAQLLTHQGRLLQGERRILETEAVVRRWETELGTFRQRIEDDGLTITDQGEIVSAQVAAAPIPYWLAAEGQQGGIQPISGGAIVDPQGLGQQIDRLRAQVRQLGPVNVEAQTDYKELKERYDFLTGQLTDLQGAEKALRHAIAELEKVMLRRFQAAFAQVGEGFSFYFEQFFGGGQAELTLSDGDGSDKGGIEIIAQPPGKRLQSLAQLSGGEKALTAVALLFALLQTNPSPFCVLDEVDAMLDEANVGRFVAALQELAQRTQFIVVTHNRRTIEVAEAIYGVSMGPDSTSRVLSLRLADVAAN